MTGGKFQFCIPDWMRRDRALFLSALEFMIVLLQAPHLSVKGANKRGYQRLSCSNHYENLAEIGKRFIKGRVSLRDFFSNLSYDTSISDATLVKRRGKRVYGAKKLKNYSSGAYQVSQDLLITTNRCKGIFNCISTFKIINYSKGLESAVLTVSGAGGVYDSTVAPGINFTVASAQSFTTNDTALFDTTAINGGIETYDMGIENDCASGKYVSIEGVACNKADGDRYRFKLYKALLTGVGAPMQHGEFMTLSIHADAMVDETLATPAAGFIEQIKGA